MGMITEAEKLHFKTSYVTVNHDTILEVALGFSHFKTSYVTVNL